MDGVKCPGETFARAQKRESVKTLIRKVNSTKDIVGRKLVLL
jgi:hypothetical protein